jgi:hypothetical protein
MSREIIYLIASSAMLYAAQSASVRLKMQVKHIRFKTGLKILLIPLTLFVENLMMSTQRENE